MKTLIFRFLLIMSMGALVSGLMFLLGSNSSLPSGGEGFRPGIYGGEFGQDRHVTDGFGNRNGESDRPDGIGFSGILLNLGKVVVISAMIVVIQRGYGLIMRKRRRNLVIQG